MTVKGEKNKFCGNPDVKENAVIEVKNLTKKYGEKLAVDHLSFKVNDGDVLGFLGPNGAGKSTTMNMLTGYLSATEGSIFVEGISMQEKHRLSAGNSAALHRPDGYGISSICYAS